MASRLPIVGADDTGRNRLWSDRDRDDVLITQRFHTPYSSAPDVITALRITDIAPGQDTIGIKTTAEDVRSKHFSLRIGIWGNGRMGDNGCNWLAIMPGDRRYRSGEHQIHRQSSRENVPIKFDPPFADGSTIKVVAWLSGFQMANDNDWHVSVTVADPTHAEFKLNVLATHATLHQAAISWFAYKESDLHIRSGSCEVTDLVSNHLSYGNRIVEIVEGPFSPKFTSVPRVMHGFSSLQVKKKNAICVYLNMEQDATPEGFPLTFASWGDTACEKLVASYVAISDTG